MAKLISRNTAMTGFRQMTNLSYNAIFLKCCWQGARIKELAKTKFNARAFILQRNCITRVNKYIISH